ncbi:S1 RNA-binding domain-containing protein [Persephonella atlantica]|uniref:S1 RNA-binding domain-containing protein n=1 Tax=Persephonella atlantica TaxID=2699429 RepID=A0ABS1GJ78_9AQUI|nr:S1 RNA-binding domain-containing protein [Persephonella atlantica]MBK3332993.1 S1 RNA-binding domain-containing protein [Persephonella atlantica]
MENYHSEFEKLLEEESANIQYYHKGERVKGRIVKIQDDIAFVDIGQKTEVAINAKEIEGLKEGDEIEAVYLGKKNKEGYDLISRKPILFEQTLKSIENALNRKEKIKAKLSRKANKGFLVDINGIKAYLPYSESGLKKGEEFPPAEFEVYIIRFEKKGKYPNIVVSRKDVIKEEEENKKREIFSLLEEGKVVKGKVVKITDKGAVLSLENTVFGFLPQALYSWDRNKKLQDELVVGSDVEVVIKEIDRENQRIVFSKRDLEPDPWKEFDKNVGDVVEAVVKEINDYGIVVKVGDLEGFIYKMETDHIRPLEYKKRFKKGQRITAKIIELDRNKRRLKLSIKATVPHPVEVFMEKNPEGSVVEGKIKEIKTKMAVVDLGNDLEGVLYLEDATWNPKIRNISYVLKGKNIKQFKVLGREGNRIKLGLKQFKENPWEEYLSKHKEGDVVSGKVIKLIDRGAFVELADEVEGFIPVKQISKEKINIPSDKLSLGQEITAKIIKIKGKDIILSIKAVEKEREKNEIKKALEKVKPKGDSLGTLGEILKEKLKNMEK